MKTLELEIQDFGKHEHILFKPEAPVVGIVGPSGAGKTVLLTALDYSITGRFPSATDGKPEAGETFVRHWGKPGGASNGSVRHKFLKNGQVYEIYRQFGKTSRQWLRLPEHGEKEKITKVALINEELTKLFGANRDAISQNVFIRQGTLDRLFYGTDGERQELFTDLLLLGHLGRVAEVADQKIKFLASSIQDMSASIDEVARRRAVVEEELGLLEADLGSRYDWTTDISTLRSYEQVVAAANAALARSEQFRAQALAAKTALEAVLATPIPGLATPITSVDQLTRLHREQFDVGAAINKAYYVMQNQEALLISESDLKAKVAQLTGDLQNLQNRQNLLAPKARQATGELEARIAAIRSWAAAVQTRDAAAADMQAAGKARDAFDARPAPDADRLAALEEEQETVISMLSRATLRCTVHEAMKGTDLTSCPACDRDLDHLEVDEAMMTSIRDHQTKLETSSKTLRETITKLRQELHRYNQQRGEILGRVASTMQAYSKAAAACAKKPEGADLTGVMITALENERDDIKAAQTEYRGVGDQITRISADLMQARKNLASLDAAALAKAHAEFDNEAYHAKYAEIEACDALITAMAARIEQANVPRKNFDDNEALRAENAALYHKHVEESIAIEAGFSTALKSTITSPDEDQTVMTSMETRQQARNELVGRITQARKQADEVKKAQQDLEERVAAQAVKQACITDLRRVRDAFGKNGLPLRFITYRFNQLCRLVQMFLARLEVNFTVEVDPTLPVAFTFTRTDEPEPYTMPQSKLSGGQRVRLALALLLAIQQLIIPDIGFLVLDEPSLHLGPEDKEAMRALFLNMAPQLANSGAQLWVCDHAPELEGSFGSILRMK